MLDFCPQDIGAKELGRVITCKSAGLSYKEVATFFKDATLNNFQPHYNLFVERYPKQAKYISDRRPTGVGPGEMVAWFLFDNVIIGGANSSCDLIIDNDNFAEMKAGRYCKREHSLDDFKLSRDHDPSVNFIVNALSANKYAAIIDYNGCVFDSQGNNLGLYNSLEFKQQIDEIISKKSKSSVDSLYRNEIIETWKSLIFPEYIEGKKMALIQTNNLKMRFFGEISKEMVGLYRIHRNQPWARVYLPAAGVY